MGIELGLQKDRNFEGNYPIPCRYPKFAGKVYFHLRFVKSLMNYSQPLFTGGQAIATDAPVLIPNSIFASTALNILLLLHQLNCTGGHQKELMFLKIRNLMFIEYLTDETHQILLSYVIFPACIYAYIS